MFSTFKTVARVKCRFKAKQASLSLRRRQGGTTKKTLLLWGSRAKNKAFRTCLRHHNSSTSITEIQPVKCISLAQVYAVDARNINILLYLVTTIHHTNQSSSGDLHYSFDHLLPWSGFVSAPFPSIPRSFQGGCAGLALVLALPPEYSRRRNRQHRTSDIRPWHRTKMTRWCCCWWWWY